MDLDELQSMKYRDLQKLAKEKGVKANQPKAEIIKNLLEINKEGDETNNEQNNTFEIEEKKLEESSVNETFEKEDKSNESVINTTFEKEDSKDEQNVDLNATFEKEDADKLNTTFEKDTPVEDESTEPALKPRFVEFTAENSNKENSPMQRDSLKRKTRTPEVSNSSKKPSVAGQARKIATPKRTKKVPVTWTPAKDYLAANSPLPTNPVSKTPITVRSKTPGKTPKPSVLSMTYLMSVNSPKTTPSRKSTSVTNKKSTPNTERSKTPGKAASSKTTLSTKKKTPSSGSKGAKGTQIPRFVSFARKAPNFAKLHEKEFNKMPSLVDTVEKKRKRTESVQEQIKRVKTIAESHQKIVDQCKSKANKAKDGAKFVPSVTSTAKMNLNFGSQAGATKAKDGPKFAPSVTSTSNMNLNFGSSSQSAANTFNFTAQKSSAGPVIKKPVSREPRKNLKTITKKSAATPKNKPSNPISKTPVIKPLVNLTNRSFSNKSLTSSPKPSFDIKASLAKPLGYKPHLGKLKPWENKKKVVAEKNGGMSFAEVKVKQQQVIKGVRLNKRAELLMQKRNME